MNPKKGSVCVSNSTDTSSPIDVQYHGLTEGETKENHNLDYLKDETNVYNGRLKFVLEKEDKHISEPTKLL